MNNTELLKKRLSEKIDGSADDAQFWTELITFIEKELMVYYSQLKRYQLESVLAGFGKDQQDESVRHKLTSLRTLLVTLARFDELICQAAQINKVEQELKHAKHDIEALENQVAEKEQKLELTAEREKAALQKKLKTVYRTLRQVDELTADLSQPEQHARIRSNIRESVKHSVEDLESAGLWPEDEVKPSLKESTNSASSSKEVESTAASASTPAATPTSTQASAPSHASTVKRLGSKKKSQESQSQENTKEKTIENSIEKAEVNVKENNKVDEKQGSEAPSETEGQLEPQPLSLFEERPSEVTTVPEHEGDEFQE